MGPLRRRMIQDMELRDFAPKTQEAYTHAVEALAVHYGRSPDLLGEEQIRLYFLHLINKRKLSRSSVRQHLCGIRFFCETTLGRQWKVLDLITPKRAEISK